MRVWMGLESPDPLVPCQCRPLWRRIIRHIGRRNHYAAIIQKGKRP